MLAGFAARHRFPVSAQDLLTPRMAALLERIQRADRPGFETMSPPEARAAYTAAAEVLEPPRVPLARVEDTTLPGAGGAALAARLYAPSPDVLPVLLYLHGGGFTIGNLETHDSLCRQLALRSGAAVVALDYRLAPEHPWPASVDDTVGALGWVARRPPALDPVTGRMAVVGDSAGGTLAALACLRLRSEQPPALPDLQVLLYPNTDLTGSSPSMRENATGFGLTADDVRTFARYWVPDETRWADPGVSPLHAPDLTGLPPALIVTAEYDPLRDEGEAYARRLAEAGVEVELRREPGLIHNFLMLDEVSPASAAAADHVAAELHDRLNR